MEGSDAHQRCLRTGGSILAHGACDAKARHQKDMPECRSVPPLATTSHQSRRCGVEELCTDWIAFSEADGFQFLEAGDEFRGRGRGLEGGGVEGQVKGELAVGEFQAGAESAHPVEHTMVVWEDVADEFADAHLGGAEPEDGKQDGADAVMLALIGDGKGDLGAIRLFIAPPEGGAAAAGLGRGVGIKGGPGFMLAGLGIEEAIEQGVGDGLLAAPEAVVARVGREPAKGLQDDLAVLWYDKAEEESRAVGEMDDGGHGRGGDAEKEG